MDSQVESADVKLVLRMRFALVRTSGAARVANGNNY